MTRRRLITFLAIGTGCVLLAVILLVSFSGRILKDRIQAALGPNVQIGEVGLSWGGVELSDVALSRDGRTVAKVRRIVLRASPLGLFKKGYALSRVLVDEPVVTLSAIESAGIAGLIASNAGPGAGGKASTGRTPISVGRLEIKNGAITVEQRYTSPPGTLRATGLNLRLDDVDYPFRDRKSALSVETRLEGPLLSGRLGCKGTINMATSALDLKVDASDIRGADAGSTGPQLRLKELTTRIRSDGGKVVLLSDVTAKEPYAVVAIDPRGDVVPPLQLPPEKPKARQRVTEGTRIVLTNVVVSGGELVVLDRKISRPPHMSRFTEITARLDRLSIPATDEWTTYSISARVPRQASTGTVQITGKSVFKTLDTDAKALLQNLDLTSMKPYISKEGDADLARGEMDLTLDAKVHNRVIKAPARAVIRNLEFAPSRNLKDRFLGVPRTAVIDYLKTANNEIVLNFTVEGSIDDPKFSFTDALTTRFAVSLAKTLGVSAIGAGETILRQGGRAIEGIQKGLRDATGSIFRKTR